MVDSVFKLILLGIVSYIIGFLTAIPVGATQVEIAKRSIAGYTKEALMVVIGSVSSDLMYGFIAMFGIAPLLENKKVEAIFWLIGGIILVILGVSTLILNKNNNQNRVEKQMMFKTHTSLLIGFSLAVTNPPIIFWWLFCFEILKDIGIVPKFEPTYAIVFLLSAASGIASYLSSLALFLKKVGRKISYKTEYKINKVLGILLILFSFYFFIKSAEVLCKFSI